MCFTANIQDAEITCTKIEAVCPLKDGQLSRGQGHPTQVQGSHTSALFMDSGPPSDWHFTLFSESSIIVTIASLWLSPYSEQSTNSSPFMGCHWKTRCRYGDAACVLLLLLQQGRLSTAAPADRLQCSTTEKLMLINNKHHSALLL